MLGPFLLILRIGFRSWLDQLLGTMTSIVEGQMSSEECSMPLVAVTEGFRRDGTCSRGKPQRCGAGKRPKVVPNMTCVSD